MRFLALLLLLAGMAAAQTPPPPRFAVESLVVSAPLPASTDGRYTVQASARLELPFTHSNERFQLKSDLAGCTNTPADFLFANGYE